ncbi:MAG: polysaccharide export protein, partial [Acetobacteraceae bacterium]|nr:polysaccharide export protein [Acetobacteraceae bacterium]
MRRLVVVSLLALLSACRGSADYSDKQTIPVIDLARASPDAMTAQRASYSSSDPGFSNFESVAYSGGRIHRGDTIEVTIFDTGEKGLFSATSSKALDLGRFTVDDGGSVNMPFVGRQYVLGLTPEAVQSRIVASLKDKAVSPQAVVKIVDSPDSTVTVAGGVHEPGRQPLRGGERVLDVIARSGGAASQPSTTTVTLIRGQQRADVPLARIVSDPQQNIYVQPDDEVIVGGRDASFTAFSGFKSVGEFRFAPGELTLAQALGRTGGLLDDRKDPRTFYLIRNQAQSASSAGSPAVIYRVNLKDASNFALMQQFQMRNGDILTTDASPVMSASSTAAPQPSASLMPSMSSLSSTSSIQGVSSLSSTSSVPGAPSMGSPSSV